MLARSFVSDVNQRLTTTAPFVAGSLQAPSITSYDKDLRNQYHQQWNVTVERALTSNVAIRISYAGSKGAHLWNPINENQSIGVARNADGTLVVMKCDDTLFHGPLVMASGRTSRNPLALIRSESTPINGESSQSSSSGATSRLCAKLLRGPSTFGSSAAGRPVVG